MSHVTQAPLGYPPEALAPVQPVTMRINGQNQILHIAP